MSTSRCCRRSEKRLVHRPLPFVKTVEAGCGRKDRTVYVAQQQHDTFREVLFPFGEISLRDRYASVCLTAAIRSQSFSLSQRFNPTRTLRLYFAPHPPLGFWHSEVFPLIQLLDLSTNRTLMSLRVMSGHKGRSSSMTRGADMQQCSHADGTVSVAVRDHTHSRLQSFAPNEHPCVSIGCYAS